MRLARALKQAPSGRPSHARDVNGKTNDRVDGKRPARGMLRYPEGKINCLAAYRRVPGATKCELEWPGGEIG